MFHDKYLSSSSWGFLKGDLLSDPWGGANLTLGLLLEQIW
jgi:hypothetical protein